MALSLGVGAVTLVAIWHFIGPGMGLTGVVIGVIWAAFERPWRCSLCQRRLGKNTEVCPKCHAVIEDALAE